MCVTPPQRIGKTCGRCRRLLRLFVLEVAHSSLLGSLARPGCEGRCNWTRPSTVPGERTFNDSIRVRAPALAWTKRAPCRTGRSAAGAARQAGELLVEAVRVFQERCMSDIVVPGRLGRRTDVEHVLGHCWQDDRVGSALADQEWDAEVAEHVVVVEVTCSQVGP